MSGEQGAPEQEQPEKNAIRIRDGKYVEYFDGQKWQPYGNADNAESEAVLRDHPGTNSQAADSGS